MADGKIHIKGKKYVPTGDGVIRLTAEAMRALAEIVNESDQSIRQIASTIILQAIENDLIVFDREGE